MAAETAPSSPAGRTARLRRLLWDGVLPEALGLGFVAVIFIGFAAAYVVADRVWRQQERAANRSAAESLVQTVATVVTPHLGTDEAGVASLLKELAQRLRPRLLEWTLSDGQVKFVWPPVADAVPGLSRGPARPDGSGTSGSQATAALASLRSPSGVDAGTLRIIPAAAVQPGYRTLLFWLWGIVVLVTLLVFVAVYQRLRRHLRPVAAVERSLQSYAAGLEQELTALTLSDSLGTIARAWNRLIEQLSELQRQQGTAPQAGQMRDVLARAESAAFRRVVDRLPFGVLCVSGDRNINYANAAAAALLGRAPDQFAGLPVREAIPEPAVMQALSGVEARPGTSISVDHTRSEGDQETTLRFRILSLADSHGGDAMITVEDIGQLREDQRARDNFLYHVTHELRTPLTSIQAYAETLTKPDFDDEQTRKECYNVIISETRRLSSLIENILSISQLEVGTARLDLGDVDLVRLLRQMVQDNLGVADEKHLDLTLSLPPKVPKIRGDKQRLAVLLTNLIGNAIKYTAERGEIRVSLEVSEQCVQIAVRDTGIGIAPEDQAHVFEKFYRAKDDAVQMTTGTGLGLAIAREVVRLHGGDIRLESERGQGSTFTVDLPMSRTETVEAALR